MVPVDLGHVDTHLTARLRAPLAHCVVLLRGVEVLDPHDGLSCRLCTVQGCIGTFYWLNWTDAQDGP